MRYGVLIPAYEPDRRLFDLVMELTGSGIAVVVVNDGSTRGLEIFEELERARVTVLRHPENRGKGRAIKTGIAWMMERGFEGAVTADADGQHTAKDIRRVGGELARHPDQLILGARDVSQMPGRSKIGNSITRVLFRLLYGVRLRDTQTGLRGFPLPLSPRGGEKTFLESGAAGLLELSGERYEYEMEMLICANRLFPGGILEVPVETVYLDENKSSHFRPVQDGAKIYSLLFRRLPGFLCTSLASFLLDEALFNLLYYCLHIRTVPATVLARLVSGTVNFKLNKRFIFRGGGRAYTAWNYWKLAVGILIVNSILMYLLVDILGLPAFLMKILVECVLYTVSFLVQSRMARGS